MMKLNDTISTTIHCKIIPPIHLQNNYGENIHLKIVCLIIDLKWQYFDITVSTNIYSNLISKFISINNRFTIRLWWMMWVTCNNVRHVSPVIRMLRASQNMVFLCIYCTIVCVIHFIQPNAKSNLITIPEFL